MDKVVNESKIIGIQFSMLSPEEIRRCSVAEITNRDTYVNNKPVIGGLFDPRMGTLEPGAVCPTDGLDYINCPGYFGHINLAKPIFYYQYLSTVINILKLVCIKCSKLLIDKNKNKQVLQLRGSERWKHVFGYSSKLTIKRCGDFNEDGCGCKQPKYKKEGFATIIAEWDGIENSMKITPELVIKIFKRISDEDITFMGFSPVWSRPEWMVCQVLAVPPPAVRPSVKHDSQQRSEDDLSHILITIIKTNKILQDYINKNENPDIINDYTTILQFYCSILVDNNISGTKPLQQRSGRSYKSIKERLNGKIGRVRGNLMGKRVDFSARSVITPDPNLSIRELGVPIRIAKNITKPVKVNDMNKQFLTQLVRNGPDVYPGAKILEMKTGEQISLKYKDRNSISLNNGDIVHRHVLNGDAILFNRQPTLHRMSMMSHIVRVMFKGNTFRMNVGDTNPYNADFDGDEMNMHMPQDIEAETELRHLAAIPYQIISPANNGSIIGIFQDSMLGAFQLTRPSVKFTPIEAMNMVVLLKNIDVHAFKKYIREKEINKKEITSYDLLTMILPPLTLHTKNKLFNSEENKLSKEDNIQKNQIKIINGKYYHGQIDKSIIESDKRGLIHRICNDFSNIASADFIDNIQYIINEYMKQSSFSVGVSDLIADKETNTKILEIIEKTKIDAKELIDQTYLGIFKNNTGRSNIEEFENQMIDLASKGREKVGEAALSNLDANNRFVIMVNAGSKGKTVNITQMIGCLGQQSIENKRVPYGFEQRTLPHFYKYDDSLTARGFVENSFISGLNPSELFFHAMGGRIGIIDTAVKTSTTGYIQRKLIKSMEDLVCAYDGTVRNNKNKIIQFQYGEDNIDPMKIEKQSLSVCIDTMDKIYNHFNTDIHEFKQFFTSDALKMHDKHEKQTLLRANEIIQEILNHRDKINSNVFNNKEDKEVFLPVSFENIINNIKMQHHLTVNSEVDITPYELFILMDEYYEKLNALNYYKPTMLFKILYYYYLSPKDLLFIKHFNRSAIIVLLETVNLLYKRAIVNPGEMVGIIAAQSIGEPTTQMTLNTFHLAGVGGATKHVTGGVPRIEEILSLSKDIKTPCTTIFLKEHEQTDKVRATQLMSIIEHTKLVDITQSVEICYDPSDTYIKGDQSLIHKFNEFETMIKECLSDEQTNEQLNWVIRLILDKELMLSKSITVDDVNFAIKTYYKNDINCIYSDYNDEQLVFRIKLNAKPAMNIKRKTKKYSLDQTDEIYMLKNFQETLLNSVILRGVKNIDKVLVRKIKGYNHKQNGEFNNNDIWVLDTVNTNLLDILSLDYIDVNRTVSNDIQEMIYVLGIEAARMCIYNELVEVLIENYTNHHHIALLCDRMTSNAKMVSARRHGINLDDIGPIAKASFEETPQMFLHAAQHAELDTVRGVSANVMCGQEGFFGTNSFDILLDLDRMKELNTVEVETDPEIDEYFDNIKSEYCNTIEIKNTINLNEIHRINDDDEYELDL